MKSLGIALLCLLGTLAWAQKLEKLVQVEEPIPEEENPLPIFLPTYSTDDFSLSAASKLNWFQAEAACASQGGYSLVTLDSEDKQNRVFLFLLNSGYLNLLNEPIWTSGSNLASASLWSWFSTGAAFKYRRFQTTPNSSYRCLGLNALTGYWIPQDCNAQRYFVCEKRCQ
ncbi:PREDICTED: snaclec rhinocetin subunit beta-like [Drosophila arizonae]|uniref:Snaclec rhinocetin subunit beta-like n=1 Tax=Drosophila arizonae TaxID=7263 RepID=A0ABM1PK60_DROAR|nr:PREDICTED: snaclec rhinocetin subunit beta-like [Drosophila arizonae]